MENVCQLFRMPLVQNYYMLKFNQKIYTLFQGNPGNKLNVDTINTTVWMEKLESIDKKHNKGCFFVSSP